MKLPYNTPVEVSSKAFTIIMNQLAGICTGREESGKYFIKCWLMSYKNEVKEVIKLHPLGLQ